MGAFEVQRAPAAPPRPKRKTCARNRFGRKELRIARRRPATPRYL